MLALVLSVLSPSYACDSEEDGSNSHATVKQTGIDRQLFERYAPDTLPMSFFKDLAKQGEYMHTNRIVYSIEDQTEFLKGFPYNLPISDCIFSHQEKIEAKSLTQELRFAPKKTDQDCSKMILNYGYNGRWGTGQQVLTFYAHIQPEDEKLVNLWQARQSQSSSLVTFEYNDEAGLKIFHQDGEELVGIIEIGEGDEEEIGSSLKKAQGIIRFVGPYVLNDVLQSQATKVLPESALAAINMISAQAGYDTPVHAALQKPSAGPQDDPLEQKRTELTNRSEAFGTIIAPIPVAPEIRDALNLVCQYAGYDSATHWYYGVPSKMKGDTVETDTYQRNIALAKGAVRLAIRTGVQGGKFVVIGSKIYEFVQGKSITETVVDKVSSSN